MKRAREKGRAWEGCTPLFVAASQRNPSMDVARLLLRAGADPSMGVAHRRGARTPLFVAVESGHEDLVRELVDAGADCSLPGSEETALIAAIRRGGKVFDYLLSVVDVNEPSCKGDPPLVLACERGSSAAALKLLDAGANPDAAGAGGWTALMRACQHNDCVVVVRRLLEVGASAGVQNGAGTTALMLSVTDRPDMAALLLASRDANVNARSKFGTALTLACAYGDVGGVRNVLKAGADVNTSGTDGTSALREAIAYSRKALLPLLIEAGADVDARDAAGETALHDVCESGRAYYVRVLLAAGASVDMRSNTGETPLALASKRDHKSIVALLLEAGARADGRP
ncbi:putative ankyrin repeat protein L93 [Diplonema papillatum]|nr:putative ankyrin repeat protein L93 [Diplonema papillatum]|eukprot:gene20280-31203_t